MQIYVVYNRNCVISNYIISLSYLPTVPPDGEKSDCGIFICSVPLPKADTIAFQFNKKGVKR